MLTLKSLSFIGIGRFVERQTIDFTRLKDITQIAALNDNTGDSSGSGKTTLFKTIEFLLGLNNIPAGVLQSRLTDETMDVEGLFDWDGIPVRIQRGKKYLVDINGVITTGNAKKTDEELAKILGMDDKLFRKILHKRQKEGGFFLKMTPAEVHKFLTTCMGLEAEADKIIKIDKDIEQLNSVIARGEMDCATAKSSLETVQNLAPSNEPKCSVDKEVVKRLFSQYNNAQINFNEVAEASKRVMGALQFERPQPKPTVFDRAPILQIEANIEKLKAEERVIKEALEKDRPTVRVTKFDRTEIDTLELSNISLREQIAALENYEKDRQRNIDNKIHTNIALIDRAERAVADGNAAKTKAQGLVTQIEKIRAAQCPTCEQTWVTDNIKTKETQLLEEIRECKAAVVAGMKAEADLPILKKETLDLRSEKLPKPVDSSVQKDTILANQSKIELLRASEQSLMKKDAEETQTALNAFRLKQQEISSHFTFKFAELDKLLSAAKDLEKALIIRDREEYQRLMDECSHKEQAVRESQAQLVQEAQVRLDTAKSAWQSAYNELSYYEKSLADYQEQISKSAKELQKWQNNVFVSESQLETDKQQLETALEAKKAVKSYLSACFEEALESISDVATTLIRGIPNMATATIQFDGLKETKEGKIKEEINAVIHMDGELNIPLKSLSGGEETAAELAIDLAVEQFIEERTGKGTNIKILDEPFNGLDFTCASNTLEMLKNSNLGKTILIVDHNPLLKEFFTSKLTVVRSGATSRVVQ